MVSLPTRMALKQEALEAIHKQNALMMAETRPLYSQVVIGRRPVPISTEQLHQAAAQPPVFNGTSANRGVDDIDECWIKITKRKARRFKTERKIQPKLNKQMELLKASGRCYRCLNRGHTKH